MRAETEGSEESWSWRFGWDKDCWIKRIYDIVLANNMISVENLDESETGLMVLQKVNEHIRVQIYAKQCDIMQQARKSRSWNGQLQWFYKVTSMFRYSNAHTFKCWNVQMFKCSTDNMFKCTDVQILKCSNVQMSNVQMFKCSNVQVFKCQNVQLIKCSNVQIFKCSNVKCSNVQMSNVQMFKCSHV